MSRWGYRESEIRTSMPDPWHSVRSQAILHADPGYILRVVEDRGGMLKVEAFADPDYDHEEPLPPARFGW